jgi:Outer membrane protein beta-barrel domain
MRAPALEEKAMTMRAMTTFGAAASLMIQAAPALAQSSPGGPPPSINVAIPQPPPADQPLIRGISRPTTFSVEGGAGILGYINGAGRLGPAWNVRVTAEFTPRFAAEANYLGAANARSDETGTLTYTTIDAGLRYNVLRADQAPVQPFVVAGLGYAGWFGPGGSPAGLVIPLTAGVERMLTEHVKINARINVRPSFGEDLGHGDEKNPPGGSTWTLLAGAGGAF